MANKPNIDEDVFAVDMEQQQAVNQETASKKKRKEDERFYKPRLVKKGAIYVGSYQTMLRPLPQKGWIQDKSLPFSQEQHMHYIKEKASGLFLYIKCRRTLGPKEKCPICDANWAMWKKAKAANDKAMEDIAKDRIAKVTAICNVLICADLNNPELNGEVKLWEHTAPINAKLLAPLRAGDTSNDAGEQEKKGFKKKEVQEKTEYFIPYHPTKGRNRIIIIEPPPENQSIVSYNQSYWDDKGSILGWYPKGGDPENSEIITPASTEEIMAVLERAWSLKEFTEDVPSIEEMVMKLNEYNEKAIEAGVQPIVDNKTYVSGSRPPLTPQRPDRGIESDFFATAESTGSAPAQASQAAPAKAAPAKAERTQPAHVETAERTPSEQPASEDDDLPF